MRLFVAVNFPPAVRAAIRRALDDFPVSDPPWRWAAPETWHLTLKFLGETARDDLPRVVDALDAVRTRHPAFEAALGGFGGFPNLRSPRVLFFQLDHGAGEVARLARDATTDWVPRALARRIDLGYDGEEGTAWIEGDPFLVRDLLGNLLDNAIRYTQQGGQVTVRVVIERDAVRLSVEDNGPGIPEPERERVFERFYRVLGTGTEGCGLGLAIVREIASSHRAEVALEPGAGGRGTVVRVTFPRAG